MTVDARVSSNNFKAFLWHTAFLALASNFMDVDTVLPAMLIESGGNAMHLGVLTMVLLGGGSFTQLFFAPYLSNQPFKKKYLIGGINARVFSLIGLGSLLYFSAQIEPGAMLWLIILLLTVFSLSGAFASVCYTDILGKSIDESARKPFFSIRQVATGIGAFISAFLAQRMLVLEAYPKNYAFMFLTGSLALFIASFGFWKLKETVPSGMAIRSLRHFLSVMSREMRETPRLAYFLGFINTQGLTLAFLPFVTLYAKTSFQANAGDTGTFLMFKVAGLVSVSLLIFFLVKNVKYRTLLYGNTVVGVLLPLSLLLIPEKWILFPVFLLGGVSVAVYSISMNGVMLELSGNHNRALCSGIAGAGNLLPALFPLAGGWLIQHQGFPAFLILYMGILALSGYFVHKVNCQK